MSEKSFDIIIIGGGTAGMTAAIYARRTGKSVLLLEGGIFGGQIVRSPEIENFPAIASVSGAEFAERMLAQVRALHAEIIEEAAIRIEDGPQKHVFTNSGCYICSILILAVGLTRRQMELPRETELIGRGLSYCAVCDGAFFRDKDAAVYGGGNTALEDALHLAQTCRSVLVIHRRDAFRGDRLLVERLRACPNVKFILNSSVTALQGETVLTGITVKNLITGQNSELPVQGLFVAIGQVPQTDFVKGVVSLDQNGFIVAGEDCRTSCDGIYAIGDCRRKRVRQLITAAADGAVVITSLDA